MRTAVFIPARWASTRLEGKPLADICGKPMIQWVYERASAARLVQKAVVATDDERIFKAVTAFGGQAVMTSADHRSGTDRIAEAASSTDADIIVNLQGDEPLIEPEMIDEAVSPMLSDTSIDICTLKTRLDGDEYANPNVVKVTAAVNGFALYFSRSPIPYYRGGKKDGAPPFKHIGLYVYRKGFLKKIASMNPTPLEEAEALEQLRALENGFRIKVVETRFNPVAVDTPDDLERVRRIMARRLRGV